MASNSPSKDNLAAELDSVLRAFERDGGDINKLARDVGEDRADLCRWRKGTTLPGHVLRALQDELPLHLASRLTGSRRRIVNRDQSEAANDFTVLSNLSHLCGAWTEALADGRRNHVETAEIGQAIEKMLPALIAIVTEAKAVAA